MRGCIPTKTLLKSAKVYQDILHSEKYGIGIGGQAEIRIDWSAMLQRKDNVVSQLTSGVENLLRQNGVDVIKGFGEVLDKNTILVNGEKVSFENLIIATGSSPTILPIPGLGRGAGNGPGGPPAPEPWSWRKSPTKWLLLAAGLWAWNLLPSSTPWAQRSLFWKNLRCWAAWTANFRGICCAFYSGRALRFTTKRT